MANEYIKLHMQVVFGKLFPKQLDIESHGCMCIDSSDLLNVASSYHKTHSQKRSQLM